MPFSKGDTVRIKDHGLILAPLHGIHFVSEMLSMCGKEAVVETVINYLDGNDNILLYRIGVYNYLEEWLEPVGVAAPVVPDNPFRLPFGTVLKSAPKYTVRGYGYWEDGYPVYITEDQRGNFNLYCAVETNKEEGV